MKVQVPGDSDIVAKAHASGQFDTQSYRNGFKAAIDYANKQLEKTCNDPECQCLKKEWYTHPSTKRPFLSDGDIRKAWSESADVDWLHGARWARDKYEQMLGDSTPASFDLDHVLALLDDIRVAVESPQTDGTIDYIERTARMVKAELSKLLPTPNVEPKWQPVVGDKVVFWNDGDTVAHPGIYREQGSHKFVHYPTWKLAGFDSYMYCAALESLDEIGKPPAYFQNRGRATV